MFAAPYFLVGIAAGLIPILIHLIYRKRAPQILFSTIRFIRTSAMKTARRRRIEDLLLLLFRVLLFSLLAIALARPFFRSGGLLRANAGVNAVVILDNSLSMAAVHGNTMLYGRAKEIAQDVIRDFPGGSHAALMLTNASSLPEKLSSDIPAVYEAAASSEPSAGRADLFGCLTAAYKILGGVKEPNREIYVVTDMQQTSWQGQWQAPKVEKGDGIELILVSVGRRGLRNLAVASATLHTRGRAAGTRGTIEVEIQNSSASDEVNLPVALNVDRQRVAEQIITVPANAKAATRFTHVFKEEGAHTGSVEIQIDDALETDNRRLFAVHIGARTNVLIVKEQSAPISFLDATFYLSAALDPSISGGVLVSQIEHAQLAGAKLGGTSVVFLANLKKLSKEEAALLKDFVEGGGSVVIFPGSNTLPGDYPESLLPATLVKPLGEAEKRDDFASVGKVDFDHPIFKPFRGLPPSAFSSVHIHRYFDLALPAGAEGRVLAYLDNGKPLLVEKGLGRGKVLLFATAADASWSNLPIRKIFLPMIHQIVYHLSEEEAGRADYVTGAPVRILLPKEAAGAALDVTDPLGRETRIEPTAAGGVLAAVYNGAAMLGKYTWNMESRSSPSGVFVVNPDPSESDLAELSAVEVSNTLGVADTHVASSSEEVAKVTATIREGVQLRDTLLALVIGIAVMECFLANRKKPAAQQEETA
ncbi:MAG: hypothetical protein GXP25_16790 [Planctomycetes bacterium]|nr:hypothetical protein [Planctomycetota bacterium]